MDKDAVKELGGFFVMLNKSLVGVEGTSDIGVGNDFRRIGLLRTQLTLEQQRLQVQYEKTNICCYLFICIRNIYC